MAKLPAIVDVLAAADGQRDRVTIHNIARTCRETGLLPPTARGAGAVDMTLTAAVNLLIATSMPVPRGDAPAAAARFRDMEPFTVCLNQMESPLLMAIARATSLGDALELLIKLAPAIDNEFAGVAKVGALRTGRHVFPELVVKFMFGAWSQGAQVFRVADRDAGGPPELIAAFRRNDNAVLEQRGNVVAAELDRDRPDRVLEQSVTFGLPMLLALHRALYKGTKA